MSVAGVRRMWFDSTPGSMVPDEGGVAQRQRAGGSGSCGFNSHRCWSREPFKTKAW